MTFELSGGRIGIAQRNHLRLTHFIFPLPEAALRKTVVKLKYNFVLPLIRRLLNAYYQHASISTCVKTRLNIHGPGSHIKKYIFQYRPEHISMIIVKYTCRGLGER